MGNPSVNCYHDSEGRWFWIVGLEAERHWPPLCRAVGQPEWIDDPRFVGAKERALNSAELIGELDAIFATRSRDEWGKRFDAEEDLWWAPVQNAQEALADPQVQAAGGIVEVPDGPTTTRLPATPVDFGGTPSAQRWMAPEHGQHSAEILQGLGHAEDRLADLRARGIIK
jgi:crotonobetainyl-CoA:carnitine CoA-transferase CaiB-like acyl-CoA transferase